MVLDDPLSAVDAHVGQSLFNDAVLGLKAQGKTVILVTHALHFLPQVDHIFHLADGVIHEEGTYEELISNGGLFSVLLRDFGSSQDVLETHAESDDVEVHHEHDKAGNSATAHGDKIGRALMQVETRKTGSISGAGASTTFGNLSIFSFCLIVSWSYIAAGGGIGALLAVLTFAMIMEGRTLLIVLPFFH